MKLLAAALLMTLALTASAARDLRGLEVAQPPADANATMEPRAFVEDFLEDPAAYFESAGEQAADAIAGLWGGEVCLYGYNCGMNCEHGSYIEDDDLDYACFKHDRCLKKAKSKKARCKCDDKLIRAADEIAQWDDDSEMVRTAPTIRDGIIALGKAKHGCYF